MKIILLTFACLLVISTCYLTREEYEEMTSNASFETLDYGTFLDLFGNKDREHFKKAAEFSTMLELESNKRYPITPPDELTFLTATNLPKNYDFRKHFPQCYTQNMVRHQENCGGCWAFATASMFSARICRKTNGATSNLFSAQTLISCDTKNWGCGGGDRAQAIEFLQSFGTTTERCVPFAAQKGEKIACPSQCKSNDSFQKFKMGSNTIRRLATVQQIKEEIYNNGPVTAGFQTYEDLDSYKGGVYINSPTARMTDRHAITIIGWDVEARTGIEHWIIQNSWGPTWGEQGHFRLPFSAGGVSESISAADV